MLFITEALFCLMTIGRNRGRVDYDGYKLFRVNATSSSELDALQGLQQWSGLDFWTEPTLEGHVDIMTTPFRERQFCHFLEENHMSYETVSDNVKRMVQEAKSNDEDAGAEQKKSMTWNSYHRLDSIYAYMDLLAEKYSDHVKVLHIGTSTENRDIKVLQISPRNNTNAPAVFVEAGMHAREWISPATATFFMKQLVEDYDKNKNLADNLLWYIIPVSNPDGYEFTHTDNRLWRKTRSMSGQICCRGTDPNRNFDHHWSGPGTSPDPCSDTYAGPKAFSEPETKAISDFVMGKKDDIRLYMALHSFSQLLLFPWGHTHHEAEDHDELLKLGRKAIEAIHNVYGTKFKVGQTPKILYKTSGASMDWAKQVAGISKSYTFELRDKGKKGFLLPPSQILPTATETWEGAKILAGSLLG